MYVQLGPGSHDQRPIGGGGAPLRPWPHRSVAMAPHHPRAVESHSGAGCGGVNVPLPAALVGVELAEPSVEPEREGGGPVRGPALGWPWEALGYHMGVRGAHLSCSALARSSLRVLSLCAVRCACMRFACIAAIAVPTAPPQRFQIRVTDKRKSNTQTMG